MLKTYAMLRADLVRSGYKAPDMKISRMRERKEIIRLRKDLYETDIQAPGCLEAAAICSPSYLSFEYVLALHGLIPEAVHTWTSAACGQRKQKIYQNALGNFTYCDVPRRAFPYEVQLRKEGNRLYPIASPEKALCDKLYTLRPIRSKKEMRYMLFEDLRLDPEAFGKLDLRVLKELCPLYKATTLRTFEKVIDDWLKETKREKAAAGTSA